MTKFARRFNSACSRFAFWQVMTAKLADFENLVHRKEHLTPNDIKAQKQIHCALYDCYTLAKEMRELHRVSLDTLRKQVTHGS